MKIAVIGAGRVGRAIGQGWRKAGHEVIYGVRAPSSPDERSVEEAGAWAEAVALTVPWAAVPDAARAMGDMAGKIIIDCTNPVHMGSGPPQHAGDGEASGAEQVAALLPGALVFKTLNQTGFETMGNPEAFPQQPVMFVAGDHPSAKAQVIALVGALGLAAVDAGPLANAGLLESLARLWIDLAFKRGLGRNFAFTLTKTEKGALS